MSAQEAGQTCPQCGEVGAGDAQWCEACGADYAGQHEALEGPSCVDCGAEHEHIADGYCGQCGRKQPGLRDHLTEDAGAVVAATDRGKRHHQNEDAFAIGFVEDRLIAVVCDGVSTTNNPEDASLAAANAARDHLVAALEAGETDYHAMLVASTAAAQDAASAVPAGDGRNGPASTTFVATLVTPDPDAGLIRTWTAWLGDSRSYWISYDADDALVVTQLTTDDVWAHHQVTSGEMSEDEALADPRAQSITKWLGADAVSTNPTIQVFEHDPGGWLLSCSDGLWKYVSTEAALADLLKQHASLQSAVELAETLVAFANESGGHDNTTVVIASPEMGKDVQIPRRVT